MRQNKNALLYLAYNMSIIPILLTMLIILILTIDFSLDRDLMAFDLQIMGTHLQIHDICNWLVVTSVVLTFLMMPITIIYCLLTNKSIGSKALWVIAVLWCNAIAIPLFWRKVYLSNWREQADSPSC